MTNPGQNGRTTLRRRPAVRTPILRLHPGSGAPMYEQLYAFVRRSIEAGTLGPGERIASTRELAAQLGVSRFTVVAAMERLLAEGYLSARRGAGTFVVDVLPDETMRPAKAPPASGPRGARGIAPSLSERGRSVSAVVITGPRSDTREPRPFRPRRPALDVFPTALWTRLIRRHWRGASQTLLDYGEPAGYRPLRAAIADHIRFARGLNCSPDQVIVTSGAQQAFDVLFRLLLDPGDRAWIEEPGYLDVRGALVAAGANLVPIPMDDHGIVVDEGIRRAPDARLAVVSPSHQYPTGATLSASRRTALLDWARKAGAWIIEDDYDSYFRYRGRPFLALHRSDEDGARPQGCPPRVIYVGTFSKTMFPALRLGFCIVPDSLVDAAANGRAIASRNSPAVDQAALAEFMADGHYDRHLRRSRMAYRERYEAMQFYVARYLEGTVSLSPASAGTHVLGWLADDSTAHGESTAVRISRAAAEAGLVVFPLSRYCIDRPQRDALVLGYGGLTTPRVASGARRLAAVVERATSRRARDR